MAELNVSHWAAPEPNAPPLGAIPEDAPTFMEQTALLPATDTNYNIPTGVFPLGDCAGISPNGKGAPPPIRILPPPPPSPRQGGTFSPSVAKLHHLQHSLPGGLPGSLPPASPEKYDYFGHVPRCTVPNASQDLDVQSCGTSHANSPLCGQWTPKECTPSGTPFGDDASCAGASAAPPFVPTATMSASPAPVATSHAVISPAQMPPAAAAAARPWGGPSNHPLLATGVESPPAPPLSPPAHQQKVNNQASQGSMTSLPFRPASTRAPHQNASFVQRPAFPPPPPPFSASLPAQMPTPAGLQPATTSRMFEVSSSKAYTSSAAAPAPPPSPIVPQKGAPKAGSGPKTSFFSSIFSGVATKSQEDIESPAIPPPPKRRTDLPKVSKNVLDALLSSIQSRKRNVLIMPADIEAPAPKAGSKPIKVFKPTKFSTDSTVPVLPTTRADVNMFKRQSFWFPSRKSASPRQVQSVSRWGVVGFVASTAAQVYGAAARVRVAQQAVERSLLDRLIGIV